MQSDSLYVAPRRPFGWRFSFAFAASLLCLAGQAARAAEATDAEAGRALFLKGATPACAVCHTLADAGSAGTIGPNLDELKPDAGRVAQAVRNGIGVMPAFEALSDADVQTLAKYVSSATGAAQ
ncbi:cytochrome c [Achromobacter sp.]|uniref:SorU family sulfite dehydrogenase c-type cytochrome subunit n=1 Tax=Achromobacter sp. TaxID=134375 RepID=UPI0028A797F3|nr:cytochrome c [Achromobacter sp.]